MNVTRENVDELNAILKITVEKNDYQAKVDKTLEDYRKRSNIPGFRKGKVPMGMIKKQYGKAVLGDELNRVVSDALYKYIEDEKIEVLGNPLPKNDIEIKGDFDNPDTFEFAYEIGISPVVDVKLSGRNKFDFTKVKVDDALIDKQVDDLTRRYGKLVSVDKVGEKDLILCQFVELDEAGEIKAGGIMNNSTISMEFVEDRKTAKEIIGKKVGDKVVVDPSKVSKGGKDTAAMLGITEEELANVADKFQMTINEIKVMEPAEMNQELFDKLFGEGAVTSEKELREKVKEDLVKMFENDSNRILVRRISNSLIEKTEFELPNEFLKRWIFVTQNSNHNHNHDHGHDHQHNHVSMEDIERDYENYVRGLRWQLIQGEIFKKNDLKIERQEAIEYTKGLLVNQYAQYGIPAPEDKELEASAIQVLKDNKEAQQIYDMLADEKMLNYFKETVKLVDVEVDYDEFLRIAQDQNA